MSIRITGLSKAFQPPEKVLDCDAAYFPSNETTVIVGKNGSGKSTLLNCIGGLLPFESGTIAVDIPGSAVKYTLEGNRPGAMPRQARLKIGHIFQQKVLWNHLSVLD